jgi:hypothetical protein
LPLIKNKGEFMKIVLLFLFAIIFSNIVLFSQCPFDDCVNDGLTKATAYQLWTKEHLIELGDSASMAWLDPYYSNWHRNKHFRLMQDITDSLRQSIGYMGFSGHFHGGGHKITLAIYSPAWPPDSWHPCRLIGGGITIDSLTIDGYIIGTGQPAGFVSSNTGTISNCVNNATLISTNLVSPMTYGIAFGNSGTITKCINNSVITGAGRIGGIAGQNGGTITNCINTGRITATNSGTYNEFTGLIELFSGVGGITAVSGPDISNCINIGDIEGQGLVGGIVGCA